MFKRKSFYKNKKNVKKEYKDITKEVGYYKDFVLIEKDEDKEDKKSVKKEKKENLKNDKNDFIPQKVETPMGPLKNEEEEIQIDTGKLLIQGYIFYLLRNFEKNNSRFIDTFKKIKEMEKNEGINTKKGEQDENSPKIDSLLKNESLKTADTLTGIESSVNLKESYKNNDSLSSSMKLQSTTDSLKILESSSNSASLLSNSGQYEKTSLSKSIKNVKKEEEEEEIDLNLNINKILSLEDKRSTIMIKNIPNKFNRELLLEIINQNFKGTYDLFVLPTDANKYKNFGYSFINFTSSYYIPYFYYMFNKKMWSGTNSKKICELTYSKVQGKKDLLGHYPSKIVFCNEEAKMVKPEQDYIIPNVYKLIFNNYFPKQKVEEYKYYFITKMPVQD